MEKRRRQGEGTVYFDASRDRWVGQAWIDNRRRKVSAKTERLAVEKLGRLIHGTETERRVERALTVATLLEDWRVKALPGRDLASPTMARHRWAVDLLTAELGKTRAADLDAQGVERALTRLAKGSQGRPLKKASLIKVRSTLTQAYGWAQKRRVVEFNPAAVADLPTDAIVGDPRRALDRAELDVLLAALAGHRYEWLFRSSAQLGLRPGEAAGLCIDALDFDAGTLSVMRSVQRDGERPVLSDHLKTKASRRTLEMPTTLADGLHSHIATQGVTSGPLWTGDHGGPVWYGVVRSELRAVCEAAKITPVVRPNELRHTFASILANDHGVPPHVLADILGHTSTAMVDAYYLHRPAIIRTGTAGLDV